MNCIVLIKCFLLVSLVECDIGLVSVKSWKQLDYHFPNSQLREFAIKHGLFIQENAVPIEAVPDCLSNGKKRIFISMPRFVPGVPVTLGTITPENKDYIYPYPDYSWHSSHGLNCDAMTSVFRVVIDECHRMWVLDTGKIESTQFCPPQILIFDLVTDRLITRYKLPRDNYNKESLLISQVVDVDDPPPIGHCANAKAYIADTTGFGLIVFDLASETSWRVHNELFEPDSRFGKHTIAGETFELPDACWDSSTDYTPKNIKIILRNEETLQFASGMKVVDSISGDEELWITTIRFQKIYTGTLNKNETNFRIQAQKISKLLKGRTKCR
ncbi:unnamed protein product [Diamesa serratosioi]